MPRLSSFAGVTIGLLLSSCREEPPVERHYPMRQPTHAASGAPVMQAPAPSEAGIETEAPPIKRERPKPDPEIEALLDIISHSGRRFIDQAEDSDSRPTQYTAEQFASMLRSKWDWLGYDIVDPDLWLDEIATRSFKTTLPYLVVLDGATVELRGWLDIERAKAKPP
jgi:hypothetical protein